MGRSNLLTNNYQSPVVKWKEFPGPFNRMAYERRRMRRSKDRVYCLGQEAGMYRMWMCPSDGGQALNRVCVDSEYSHGIST